MRTYVWFPGLVAVLFVGALAVRMQGPGATDAVPGPAAVEIRGEQMAAHVRFLSHDLLEGRAPATRGGDLAAEYLAAQLALIGFEPAGDNGTYFQQVPIIESVVDPSFTLTVGRGAPFRYLQDVVAFTDALESRVQVAGEVVFVGHGIVAPEYDWNDYAGADMTGRIALIMVNDPPATAEEPELFAGEALTYYGRWTYKFEEAARQGAAGAILIHTDASATYPWQVVETGFAGTQYSLPPEPGQPALLLKAWVTDNTARELVRRGGRDLDALRQAALRRGAAPVPLDVRASASIVQAVERRTSPNVIGVLRGTRADEAIVYTAHYDHLGMRDPRPDDPPGVDRIFNGARDNASGLAGTLAVAQEFARRSVRPSRSIYVLFTTAEESGLLGAEYFAANLPLPAERWAANINIDSLNIYGPARDIVLLGAERSTLGDLAAAVAARHDRVIGPDPAPGRGYFFRSDHFPLAKIGIPALSISDSIEFIGPTAADAAKRQDAYNDTDYHQPSDRMQPWWDFAGAVRDMRLLAELGWDIANDPQMPAYHAGEQFARARAEQ